MFWLRLIGATLMIGGIVDISLLHFAHINLVGISGSAYFLGILGMFLAELGRDPSEDNLE